MVHLSIDKIAEILKSKIRGWINYYGKFRKSGLRGVFRILNFRLAYWVRNKYRRFRRKHPYFAYLWLSGICRDYPNLFIHWSMVFVLCLFLLKSRMNREVQVRFCERFGGVTTPYLLDLLIFF